MLWWLADELTHLLHDDKSVKLWLENNQDGLFTPEQRQYLGKAGRFVGEILFNGVKD